MSRCFSAQTFSLFPKGFSIDPSIVLIHGSVTLFADAMDDIPTRWSPNVHEGEGGKWVVRELFLTEPLDEQGDPIDEL